MPPDLLESPLTSASSSAKTSLPEKEKRKMSMQLTPPETSSSTPLVLNAPAAVEIVKVDDAPGMVPVPAERQQEINAQARAFISEVSAMSPFSPEYSSK